MIPQLSIAKYSTIHLLLEYHQMKIISFLKLLYMTFGVYVFVVCYYRSGIYFYTPEQEKAAKESLENHQKAVNRKIVTEILPA
jgi:hypothetical protein